MSENSENTNLFADAESREQAVQQAVGAASTCWENTSGAGVFLSEKALRVSRDLMARLDELAGQPPKPGDDEEPMLGILSPDSGERVFAIFENGHLECSDARTAAEQFIRAIMEHTAEAEHARAQAVEAGSRYAQLIEALDAAKGHDPNADEAIDRAIAQAKGEE